MRRRIVPVGVMAAARLRAMVRVNVPEALMLPESAYRNIEMCERALVAAIDAVRL